MEMELFLCLGLPNELIEIIIDKIRLHELSNYLRSKLYLSEFLHVIRANNCILTCRFTENYTLSDYVTVYGEYSPNHIRENEYWYIEIPRPPKHPFELYIPKITLLGPYVWEYHGPYFWGRSNKGNKLKNIEYIRYFSGVTSDYMSLTIKFISIDMKLEDYIKKLTADTHIVIIN